MRLRDIPQFTRDGGYQVNQPWNSLEDWLVSQNEEIGIDLNPDYQRGHVWSEIQQRRFVEFCLQGGKGSDTIRFNCVGWMQDFRGPFELVDGKQRLEAIRKFMRNELLVFGRTLDQYEGRFPWSSHTLLVRINDLPTRREVLQWYLDINTGGVVHTEEEISNVKALLASEPPAG